MARVLANDVHVTDEKNEVTVLRRGDKVPKKFEKYVTNPKAFDEEAESEESDETEQETGDKPYAERSKGELVALLKERELPHSGNVPELAARLEKADEEAESEESDETEQETGDKPNEEE